MAGALEGTAALVTGASSGIGAAAARALAARGAAVMAVARRKDRLDALVDEIAGEGGRAIAIDADITDGELAASVVARAVGAYGRLDILVNSAGVMLLGSIVETPVDSWQEMLDVNVSGLLAVTHAALPHLLAAAADEPRQVADIVNISSTAGRTVRAGSGMYNVSKWGVGVLSEALRQEVTGRYVRVAVLEPGPTRPSELGRSLPPEVVEYARQRLAGVTAMTTADIAETIAFIVTRPRDVAINEVLVRPTTQVL